MNQPQLICSGCGWSSNDTTQLISSCPNTGSSTDSDATQDADTNHVLVPIIAPTPFVAASKNSPRASENPFIRHRKRLYGYHQTRAMGFSDTEIVNHLKSLNEAIERIDGEPFLRTPFTFSAPLNVWIKDETNNVSGSHKARHLMGLLIPFIEDTPDLKFAIASCGNAALAAGVLAAAAEIPLDVYIPADAKSSVVARLQSLGATCIVCERDEKEPGDPCVARFREAVTQGAFPFSCQGPDNGLTIEGGKTLGYELIEQLLLEGQTLDHLVIQVGGGALASALIQAFEEAFEAGSVTKLPRIHTLQTKGAFPLQRAWDNLAKHLFGELFPATDVSLSLPQRDDIARQLREKWGTPEMENALQHATTHRAAFMWPWETPPKSIAHGILDDETYDWFAVLKGMLRTGGVPIVADEALLREAHKLATEHTKIPVSHTGVSGFAGLLAMTRANLIGSSETSAVLFTGQQR